MPSAFDLPSVFIVSDVSVPVFVRHCVLVLVSPGAVGAAWRGWLGGPGGGDKCGGCNGGLGAEETGGARRGRAGEGGRRGSLVLN